jgi:uncharacterized membrane protein
LALFAVAIGLYGIAVVFRPQMGASFLAERFLSVPLAARLHVSAAGLALLLGPFQFSNWLRARYLRVHRWTGRTYVTAVLLGGTSGLLLATMSEGGVPAHFGFGLLAIVWLSATTTAYFRIRGGDQVAHRRWMIRSFALTFAAVTLRIYLPLGMAAGIPFESAYPAIAWLCWVPNLIVAEWFVIKA